MKEVGAIPSKPAEQSTTLRTFAELAAEHRLTYHAARAAALKGEYGRVIVIGGRYYVEQPESGSASPAA
jgi:hypothetical protein